MIQNLGGRRIIFLRRFPFKMKCLVHRQNRVTGNHRRCSVDLEILGLAQVSDESVLGELCKNLISQFNFPINGRPSAQLQIVLLA